MNLTKKSEQQYVNVGITQPFPCSYLKHQHEQLMVIQNPVDVITFEQLLALGFRRSGKDIYKPHCQSCNACQAIRIPCSQFKPSSSQRKTLKKNKDLTIKLVNELTKHHYPLYEKYINTRHQDSSMYPASKTQFTDFLGSCWLSPKYIELYKDNNLIAVAVTDFQQNSLSAIYTFFEPKEDKRSLGNLMILIQCKLAKLLNKTYLYLGYQIDSCEKMNYKSNYKPYEILTDKGWSINH